MNPIQSCQDGEVSRPLEGVLYLPGVFRICKLCAGQPPHLLEAWLVDRDVSEVVPSAPKVRPQQHVPGRSCHSGALSGAGSDPSSHTLPFRTSNSSPRQKSLCSLPNPLNKLRFAHTKGRKKGPLQSPQDKGAQRLWIQCFKKGQERKLRRAAWKGLRVFQIYQPPRQKRTAKPSWKNCSRTTKMAELLEREEGICNVRMFNSLRSPHLSKALGTQT